MPVTMPTSLDATVAALSAQPDALVLSGGTDLMVEVNDGRRRLDHVVSLRRVDELRGWHVEGRDLVLGAATTYTELLAPELQAMCPALAAAARTVGSPQIRNTGTIGGNLGTSSPAGDALPVLVALGATIEIAGAAGRRALPIADFFLGPKRNALEPGELIAAVRIPMRRGPQDYLKVGVRNAMVIAVASLAFAVDLDERSMGVGLGSVGPTPLAAPDASQWLTSRLSWTDDGIALTEPADAARFGELVADAARPIDDHRSTASYRGHAVAVLARRALRRALA